jgi:hypothetical protein
MPNFFVLIHDGTPDDISMNGLEDPDDFREGYARGEPLRVTSGARLFYKGDHWTDYVAGIFVFPVVSPRFRAHLHEMEPENIEFLPVTLVHTATGEMNHSYTFANILHHVPCFDPERSNARAPAEAPDIILGFERLALREEAIGNRHVFRVAEWETPIIVSDVMRQRIVQAGLTGMNFVNVAEYHS